MDEFLEMLFHGFENDFFLFILSRRMYNKKNNLRGRCDDSDLE